MKTCFKCHEHKPLSEFYAHPQMSQGTLNKCKDCTKKDAIAHYKHKMQEPLWVAKERERQRAKERARRAAGGGPKPQIAAAKKAWEKRNPHKKRACGIVRRGIVTGILSRQPCEVCGDPKTQAHHDDYSRPLDVRWLCVKHHNEHHVSQRLQTLMAAA